MPQVVVAAAAMIGQAVTVVSAGVGLTAASGALGAAVANGVMALGFQAGVFAGVSAWATVASVGSAMLKPKVGGARDGGTQVDFKANPNAGVPLVIGRTGTGGVIAHMNTTGQANKNRHLATATILSAGPIEAVESFSANGQTVTFSGDTAQSPTIWYQQMWMRYSLGAKPAARLGPGGFTESWIPEWGTNHKLSGLAFSWWTLYYSADHYPTGVPKPLWVVKGPAVYDPRKDSTYPGGSGPQRSTDETTWSFVGNDNPYLQALTYCLGRRSNGKLTHGVGVPASAIDVAAFVEGANVCDNNGWKCGGVITSTDRKWDVLVAMLQAGGGVPLRLGGRISCVVNAPRVSLATVTGADVVGNASITGTKSRRDRFNRAVPRYRSEAHGWEIVDSAPIEVSTYITEDGGVRTREIEFPLVQSVNQAAQLATYAIVDAREAEPITLPLKPQYLGYQAGDALTVNEPELGLNGQKVVVLAREFDPVSMVVTLTVRTETDAKHAFALGKTGVAPPTPSLTGVDASVVFAPVAGSWTATGGSLAGASTSLPAITVTGAADVPVQGVIVEYRQSLGGSTYGPWITREYPPTTTNIVITDVVPGATYQVRVRYRNIRGVEDATAVLSLGSVTVGQVQTATDTDTTAPAAPTGLTAVGSWNSVYLAWTNPSASDLDRVDIYEHTANNSALASRIGSQSAAPGAFGAYTRAGLPNEVTRYYWLKAVDRSGNASGFSAVASATTAGIDFDDFAANIQPIMRGGTLPNPTTFAGDLFLLTTDGKLYRKSGTTWTTAVPAVDVTGTLTSAQIADLAAAKITGQIGSTQIADDAISTPKLAAGSVVAAKIAAGAVTTEKLLVTGVGGVLNSDPNFQDATAWSSFSGPLPTFATITDGAAGTGVARSSGAGVGSWINGAKRIPIDASRRYRISCSARTISGTGSLFYMGVALFDAAGANIAGDGTQWFYAASGVQPPAGWTGYEGLFGAGTAKTFPSNARSMAPIFILSLSGGTSVHEIQNLKLEEVFGATLIQDGAITTNKIAAGAVTATQIAAGTITGDRLVAGTVQASHIAAGTISGDRIAAGTITANNIIGGAVTTVTWSEQSYGGTITSSPTQFFSVGHTTSFASAPHVIHINVNVSNPGGSPTGVRVQIFRDGNYIGERAFICPAAYPTTGSFMVFDQPSAGGHTYTMQVNYTPGSYAFSTLSSSNMVITELKR